MANRKDTAKGTAAPAAPADNLGEAYEPPTQEAPAATAKIDEEVVEHALVPRGSTAVASLSDVQALMLEDAEEELGFEKGDVALPFMRVLQSNSPQVKRQNAQYIEEAEAGFFFNTATKKVYDGDLGIDVIPVFFTKQATLWTPRGDNGGGGFISECPMDLALEILKRCTKNEKGKDITPADLKGPAGVINQDWASKELSIAAMYYLLVVNKETGEFEPVAFPFTSTQMKKSRQWNAIIQNSRLPHPGGTGSYRAPMFGFVYHLSTVPEQNAKGDWMGIKIAQGQALIKYINGAPQEQFAGAANLYLAARDFKQAVAEGRVKVKAEEGYDEGGDAGAAGGGGGGDKDDDMPF
jgi:hypothetical protein